MGHTGEAGGGDIREGNIKMRRGSLEEKFRSKIAVGRAKFMFCRISVSLSCQNCRIEPNGHGKSFVFAARHRAKRAWKPHVDGFEPYDLAILRTGVIQAFTKFVELRPRVFDAFSGLFQIAFAGPPARKAGVYVGKNLFMGRDVLFREAHEPKKTDDIDIGFGGVKRDQFGSLSNPKCRSVHPCGLAPNLMYRSEDIKREFVKNHFFVSTISPWPGSNYGCSQAGYRRNSS